MREFKSNSPFVPRLLRGIVLGATALALVGCAGVGPVPVSLKSVPECKGGQRLEVSQGCRFAIPAREASTVLPVKTVVGDQYKLEVPSGQKWTDLIIRSDPLEGDDGFWLMNLASKHRRIPDKNWFVLGVARRMPEAAAGGKSCNETDARQVLGSDTLRIAEPGEVVFFANDVCGFHWNNHGGIWVRIERAWPVDKP